MEPLPEEPISGDWDTENEIIEAALNQAIQEVIEAIKNSDGDDTIELELENFLDVISADLGPEQNAAEEVRKLQSFFNLGLQKSLFRFFLIS